MSAPGNAVRPIRALHQRITDDIVAKIRSGAWPPGFRIPFEHELSMQYGCARATANKAVLALTAAGLVERRRRAGSFVALPPIQSAVLEIPDIESEINRQHLTYAYELVSCRKRRGLSLPDAADLGPCGPVLEIRCRHLADARPFAFEERIINLAAAPEAATTDFARSAPGAWLSGRVAWTQARHAISAVNPDVAVAELLEIPQTSACLALKRWTWRAGLGVTYARQIFRGEAFELVARFTPALMERASDHHYP